MSHGVTKTDRYQGQEQPDRPQDVGPDHLESNQDSIPRNIEFTHATSINMGSVSFKNKNHNKHSFLTRKAIHVDVSKEERTGSRFTTAKDGPEDGNQTEERNLGLPPTRTNPTAPTSRYT